MAGRGVDRRGRWDLSLASESSNRPDSLSGTSGRVDSSMKIRDVLLSFGIRCEHYRVGKGTRNISKF